MSALGEDFDRAMELFDSLYPPDGDALDPSREALAVALKTTWTDGVSVPVWVTRASATLGFVADKARPWERW